MVYKTVDVDIDIDLDDFTTQELLEELDRRSSENYHPPEYVIHQIYQKRRTGQDYQRELDQLIYNTIGRIV